MATIKWSKYRKQLVPAFRNAVNQHKEAELQRDALRDAAIGIIDGVNPSDIEKTAVVSTYRNFQKTLAEAIAKHNKMEADDKEVLKKVHTVLPQLASKPRGRTTNVEDLADDFGIDLDV